MPFRWRFEAVSKRASSYYARGYHPDEDLIRCRLRLRRLDLLQHIWPAVAAEADRSIVFSVPYLPLRVFVPVYGRGGADMTVVAFASITGPSACASAANSR
jgi:hypothetical protein